MNEVTMRRARPDEAKLLSELALAAKGFWGYDEDFLESCRGELTFDPAAIARRRIVVAEIDGAVAGFYSVDGAPPAGELGNMWITPGRIGTGLGRVLWQDAMTTAAAAGFARLEIGAEPNAEGFYRRMGAERVGAMPSGSIPGRVLPLMRVTIGGARAPA
jgi:GNAT superfamily N-acetyltransferase